MYALITLTNHDSGNKSLQNLTLSLYTHSYQTIIDIMEGIGKQIRHLA